MKVSPGIHIEWVDTEAVVLDNENSLLHHLNPPAALALALIEEYGYEEGVRMLEERHGGDRTTKEEISDLLLTLVSQGLLVNE